MIKAVFLYGPKGSGKSTIAPGLMRRLGLRDLHDEPRNLAECAETITANSLIINVDGPTEKDLALFSHCTVVVMGIDAAYKMVNA